MQNPTATLYCPHPSCQTLNPEGNKFCLKCGSFLPRHYLWYLDKNGLDRVRLGEFLGDRYLLKTDRILLDTHPGLPPETPEDILPHIAPYLKLFAYRLHVPQVYGRVSIPSPTGTQEIWLLEQTPILVDGDRVGLHPTVTEVWRQATPMRQLNWLWQVANLWSPFLQVGVASSLLNPQLIRVEGATLRLLELTQDPQTPTLKQLGQFWLGWVDQTCAPIKHFLHRLCQLLIDGQVRSTQQLISLLDRGLAVVGRSQSRQIQRVTLSDQGPSRTRNEDSCYPPSGMTGEITPEALVIVCDGVGGHEGGDVASQIAIEAISEHLQPFLKVRDDLGFQGLSPELEQSIYDANNAISAQNNNEQRQGRQRMGTTVAIGLTHAHECYITHVGDSRAYRITRSGCHQLTLDDDVASREVRLGYALYRHALQQVAAGSLVQAIGMGSSNTLYPNINRTIVDEDCLFLFCSDGLSDYDRVEQYWQDELIPVLEGKLDLAEAAHKLVSIANTLNGHDNVTVALIHIQVAPVDVKSISADLLLDQLDSIPTSSTHTPPRISSTPSDADETEDLPTQIVIPRSRTPRSSSVFPIVIAFFAGALALAGAGAFAYFQQPMVRSWVDRRLGREIAASPIPTTSRPSTAILEIDPQDTLRLKTGTQLWKVLGERTKGFETVPAETVLQVVNKQDIQDELWLEVQVCTVPETANTPIPDGKPSADVTELAIEKPNPSPTPKAKDNEPEKTPSPVTTSPTQDPQATPASPTATAKVEDTEETQTKPSTSSTPNTEQQTGETVAGETPTPASSSTGKTPSDEPKPIETFWIVAAELDRSGFDPITLDRDRAGICQPPTSLSLDHEEKP
jgi:protein phosphatase